MIRHIPLEEDNALKRFALTPDDQKPRFNWREVIVSSTVVQPDVMVLAEGVARHFDLAEIAETVGSALTDLLLSRQVQDIYTEQNRQLVAEIAKEVGEEIVVRWAANKDRVLSEDEINRIIEKALVHQNQHDVAKSLVFKRSGVASAAAANGDGSGTVAAGEALPVHVRLIRRNGQVVPWDQNKVEIAVRKAFLSLHLDSEPAVRVAESVSDRVRDLGQAFVSIEDVQDMVAGGADAARPLQGGRGLHSLPRASAISSPQNRRPAPAGAADARQEQIIFVKRDGGQSEMWDGAELRARIEFAAIGLDLCLTARPDRSRAAPLALRPR